jgi:hypothetical protein
VTDPFIKISNPHQCGQVLPVRNSVGSGIVIEHICVEPKGHDGLHRDINGNVWVNIEGLMRLRGMRE